MSAEQTTAAVSTPGRDPFLVRLKDETRTDHERAERAVGLMRQLQSLAGYQGLLGRFYGLYQPLEAALRASSVLPDELRERLIKTGLLERDLAGLEMSSKELAALPICHQLPALNDSASCIGSLYVLEGATLGGQIVRRVVEQHFPEQAESICHFFNPYGSQTGKMWTDFCSTIAAFVRANRHAEDQVIAAAKATFACFERWLQQNTLKPDNL